MCLHFDGPRKHVDLLEQLLDVSRIILRSYCWVVGTARSKQTTSKRKTVKSNDCQQKAKEVKRV